MARGKKHYEPKRGKYKRDNQYIEISDDDTEEEVDELDSTPSPPAKSDRNGRLNTGASDSSKSTEEDFISFDWQLDTRSRQQKRSEERADLKRKREIETTFNDSWENELCFPWVELMDIEHIKNLSAQKLLQKEVQCFIQYLTPTKIEMKLREYLVHRIKTAIESKLPGSKVVVFGSFSTQLYLPNSDIDMVVIMPPSQNVRLRRIAGILESEEICRDPRLIEHASVPVMKFEDIMTKLKVDIILNSTSGVDSAQVINGFVEKYPVIRPISLIVKHLLALRNLNEVYTGGLGGYAIVCLVVSFLQMHPKVASGAIDPMENLGVLLLDFFQLYGINFSMEDCGIDVTGDGSYYKSQAVCRDGKPVFSIRDPQDAYNDIGLKSYNSSSVVRAFKYAYLSMTRKQFALEAELKEHNYRRLSTATMENPRLVSILSSFLYISIDFIKQRQLLLDVYREKRWRGQSAAETFSFGI